MKKFGISSRVAGKVIDNRKIANFNIPSFDVASLYPSVMGENSEEFKKILLKLNRKKKLEQLKKISDDEISDS